MDLILKAIEAYINDTVDKRLAERDTAPTSCADVLRFIKQNQETRDAITEIIEAHIGTRAEAAVDLTEKVVEIVGDDDRIGAMIRESIEKYLSDDEDDILESAVREQVEKRLSDSSMVRSAVENCLKYDITFETTAR